MSGQRGSGLHAGPRHDSQPRAKMQAGEATATVRPHLRAVFLSLTLPRQQTEPPPEFTKTNAPTVGSAQETELPGQADSSPASQPGLPAQTPAQPPRSCDPVISRGPETCSILGLQGSDVTRSPSPGFQAHPGPKEPPRRWPVGLSLLLLATHPSPGKRATSCQGEGVWYGLTPLDSLCSLSCAVPLSRLIVAQALPP